MRAVKANRRQFLQSGLMATALAAAGKLPLLAGATENESSIDAASGPGAIKPIRDWLQRFSTADTKVRDQPSYNLTYDIIHWNWGWVSGKGGTIPNSVVGHVVIKRRLASDGVVYQVAQQMRIGGVDNFLDAEITCNADDLNSLRTWKLHSYEVGPKGQADSLSELTEKGDCKDGKISIDGDSYSYCYSPNNPAVTQWTMLDFLIRKATPRLSVEFDLLQDLSLFKPNQSLVYDGRTPVPLKDARKVTLETYAQTGEGILPIHYLLDHQGRPQLITSSILSWALSG